MIKRKYIFAAKTRRGKGHINMKLSLWTFVSLCLGGIMISCGSYNKSPFRFREEANGISLTEDDQPVYWYQKMPKSLTGEYVCNNYLHPLYSLEGDTLTEEFPPDHTFHRGIFWAWHQLFLDGRNLGDGWTNQGISYQVAEVKTKADSGSAILETTVMWQSDSLENKKAFIREHTRITVSGKNADGRRINFEITLIPLSEGIEIGGSADEKGYGGFCSRIKMPDDLCFVSGTDSITPQNLQIEAGDRMTFTGSFGNSRGRNSLTIISNPENPGYPEKWILRRKGSMQNIVFPGRDRMKLEKPLTLKYSIVIH